jgi:hypothetical protein
LAPRPAPAPGLIAPPPTTPLQAAFREAVGNMKQNGAGADHPKFGQLIGGL